MICGFYLSDLIAMGFSNPHSCKIRVFWGHVTWGLSVILSPWIIIFITTNNWALCQLCWWPKRLLTVTLALTAFIHVIFRYIAGVDMFQLSSEFSSYSATDDATFCCWKQLGQYVLRVCFQTVLLAVWVKSTQCKKLVPNALRFTY